MSAAEEGRPDTATVPRFRYLFDRGSPPTAFWPCLGDFVVLTIDPVASVGHLDVAAKRAARKIPRHRFVALVMSGRGIPLETKPFTHHSIALVRRELPTLNHPPWDTPEMCYPILPNTHHPTRSETIQPTHPFPLVDCYIDMTWAFQDPIGCRITTTPCNYTSVLRVMPRQIARLSRLFSQEVTRVEDLEERIRYGDIEVIASIPLPPSPASAARIPLPESPTPSPVSSVKRSQRSRGSKSGALYSPGTHAASDEVSIIGSDDSDSSSSNYDRESEVESDALDGQLFEMMRFEDMVNDTGDPRDPVADVSYDLDDVDEVTDPLLFIKVRDQLRSIIDDAELRLGIRDKPAPEQPAASDSSSTSSVNGERPASILPPSDRNFVHSEQHMHRNGPVARLLERGRQVSRVLWTKLRQLTAVRCHASSAMSDADD